jgi:hypothetical protein
MNGGKPHAVRDPTDPSHAVPAKPQPCGRGSPPRSQTSPHQLNPSSLLLPGSPSSLCPRSPVSLSQPHVTPSPPLCHYCPRSHPLSPSRRPRSQCDLWGRPAPRFLIQTSHHLLRILSPCFRRARERELVRHTRLVRAIPSTASARCAPCSSPRFIPYHHQPATTRSSTFRFSSPEHRPGLVSRVCAGTVWEVLC